MIELIPCPFCKSYGVTEPEEPELKSTEYTHKWHWIECPVCLARGPECRTPEDARKEWNSRPELEQERKWHKEDLDNAIDAVKDRDEIIDKLRSKLEQAQYRIRELEEMLKYNPDNWSAREVGVE